MCDVTVHNYNIYLKFLTIFSQSDVRTLGNDKGLMDAACLRADCSQCAQALNVPVDNVRNSCNHL